MAAGEFWCLARHEMGPRWWELWNVPFSQDGWAWMGECKIRGATFLPGTMGCDSVMCYLAFAHGYNVGNPSRSIRVCHRHAGEQRTALSRLPGPYGYIAPHEVLQRGVWRMEMSPTVPNKPAVWKPK
jgi:hypothetical protein